MGRSVVGLVIIGVLILLPRLQDGDFYEVGDPLVYLGLPILLICSAVGAVAARTARDLRSVMPAA